MNRWAKWIGAAILSAKVAIVLIAASPIVRPDADTFTSRDGKVQLVVPAGWSQASVKNHDSALRIEDKSRRITLTVDVLAKDAPNQPLELRDQAAAMLENALAALSSRHIEQGPSKTSIHGRSALQYQLTGIFNECKVTCLFTVVETERAFYQILVFTPTPQFSRNEDTLDQVISSFVELP
jgi:hypothetical protein